VRILSDVILKLSAFPATKFHILKPRWLPTIGGARDQPRRHRLFETPRLDRGGDPRASARAPFAYVTTKKFLETFGLASLRDLPDLERPRTEGLAQGGQEEDGLNDALGLTDDEELGIPKDKNSSACH
jgi:hypothetical protein